MLRVVSEEIGNTVVLRCAGRIVKGEETALLCLAIRQRERNVILDLSEVDAIDAAGVGALISLQAAGIYLHLLNPTRAVREVLQITGVDSVFEICSSLPTESDEQHAPSSLAVLTPLPA
jgi:anti-anti-sigma factor